MSLADLLLAPRAGGPELSGVVVGVVTDARDPDGLGRVRVEFPLLAAEGQAARIQSDWVRVASFFAGRQRGAFFLPRKDDEVLLAFAHGNVALPYVVGVLWNGVDRPPVPAKEQQAVGEIRTAGGHRIRFDDAARSERIEITDRKGNRVLVDTKAERITVKANKEVVVEVTAGKVVMRARDITLQATGKLSLRGREVEVTGTAGVRVRGATVDLN